ncbi:phage virion morphogenesis protein [Halomonas pacifica]|uniref:phage virion morphogenesis protein n=1 Tax=Bisbaumannia pacifica TaxID=77098 RepID=UPI00235889EC|nr:phage virion morphogenesis protein [Halomonas pacifica]MDC8802563.1 phage virion morphogenesis protein [Halomonas pacifica]
MDSLRDLEAWAEPLLARLTPAERRRLARTIATELRRRQRERIAAQRAPDGTPFEPRKPQARRQAGFVRRQPMFTRIRQAKHLRTKAHPGQAEVGFIGRVARIARIHQLGLRDRVEPGGPVHDYAQRELLGYSDADRQLIRDLIIQHLAGR